MRPVAPERVGGLGHGAGQRAGPGVDGEGGDVAAVAVGGEEEGPALIERQKIRE